MRKHALSTVVVAALAAVAPPALAAPPPEPAAAAGETPPSPWSGHAAAGFNFTNGNSQTRSFNLALDAVYDPHTGNVIKADAFYLRSSEAGASTVDRTSAHLRDERAFRPRWFAYGDVQYFKDKFKAIDYLITPTVGVGYRLIQTEARQLDVDLGAGLISERDNPGERTDSGAVRAGEAFTWNVSKSAVLANRAFGYWKTGDFADAYYHFDVSLAASVAEHVELKVALIDEYKRKPPNATVERNDLAGIVSVGYKL